MVRRWSLAWLRLESTRWSVSRVVLVSSATLGCCQPACAVLTAMRLVLVYRLQKSCTGSYRPPRLLPTACA